MRHQSHTTNKALLRLFGKDKLLNMRLVHVEPSAGKTKNNKIVRKGKILKVFTNDGLWTLLDKGQTGED
jgi:hypothetical protein